MQQPGLSARLQQERRRVQQQHRRLRELGESLLEALGVPSSPEIERLLDAFRAGLDAHFSIEEGILFPALHGHEAHTTAELEALIAEHHALRAALIGRPNRARFSKLLAQIRDHERREEALFNSVAP